MGRAFSKDCRSSATRAQRQALELQRRARSQSAQGATRTQVRRLDLNETKGSRAHYDMNADAEYQARVARRAAQTAAQPAAPQAAPQQEDTVMQASRSAGKTAAGSGEIISRHPDYFCPFH